ncbi:MAG: hypothetical protein IE909_16100, partial [Campylobacterales bacterium]|nr:hypothetical protein [Campylobacterales bacterium]
MWKKYVYRYKKSGGNQPSVPFGFHNFNGTINFRNIKLERGMNPSEWTPAPEDVTAEIAVVAQDVADVTYEMNQLQTNFTNFAQDGVIDIAEAAAIGNYVNSLNAERADLFAKFAELDGNVFLTGTPKNQLTTAFGNYENAHDD